MNRYTLMTKALIPDVPSAATGQAPGLRTGNVPMDEGRGWAGDLYTEGSVTDPDQAFAKFTPGDNPDADSEAWLDRNEDGTLVGWLREGADIYRYSDAEAWALDVDGAQWTRADAGIAPDGEAGAAGGELEGDPAADPDADLDAVTGEQLDPDAVEEETVDPHEDPSAVDPVVDPETGEPVDETEDPTEDPHKVPEVDPDDEEEFDNPFAADGEDDTDAPTQGGEGTDPETVDDPADADKVDADDEDVDEKGKPKKKAPPFVKKKK